MASVGAFEIEWHELKNRVTSGTVGGCVALPGHAAPSSTEARLGH